MNNFLSPETNYRYIRLSLIVSCLILISYSIYNLKNSVNLLMIVPSVIAISALFFDFIYIVHSKKIFLNLMFTIISIVILDITLIYQPDNHIIRAWFFILPLIVFYTQGIRFSIIFLLSIPNLGMILSFYAVRMSQNPIRFHDIEQLIVYNILVIFTYFYAKSADNKNKMVNTQLYTNHLTGLPNRTKLLEDTDNEEYKTLVLINIDSFNEVNNLYGIKIGDKVLTHIAEKLVNYFGDKTENQVYKLHADEYGVLFKPAIDIPTINSTLNTLPSILGEVIKIEEIEIHLSVSIGVSTGYHYMVKKANLALNESKKSSKRVVIYKGSMNQDQIYHNNLIISKILKTSIKNSGIVPFFQPVVNLKTGEQTRFECLARLINQDKTFVPFEFLNLSKKIRVYPEITKMMIDKTFSYFSKNSYIFSINLDIDDLTDNDTTNYIYDKIIEYNIGERLVFELLESKEITDINSVVKFITSVKNMGCKIAIDDFGAGYSNFNYLIRFNVDYLKIDSSIIKNLDTDYNSKTLVKSIVSFSKKLGIKTIAEHIDRESVLKVVKELGIDFGQGYYWSEPVPSMDINVDESV